jgi:hypothetical protein
LDFSGSGRADTVPFAADPQARCYLPILFSASDVRDLPGLVAAGLDSGRLMVLVSRRDRAGLLDYLRRVAGLFLSPTALQNVLGAVADGGAASILGPVSGVLLGSNSRWQFFARQNEFPDAAALGLDFADFASTPTDDACAQDGSGEANDAWPVPYDPNAAVDFVDECPFGMRHCG